MTKGYFCRFHTYSWIINRADVNLKKFTHKRVFHIIISLWRKFWLIWINLSIELTSLNPFPKKWHLLSSWRQDLFVKICKISLDAKSKIYNKPCKPVCLMFFLLKMYHEATIIRILPLSIPWATRNISIFLKIW